MRNGLRPALISGLIVMLCLPVSVWAHFDILIGSAPWVERGETATFTYYSGHPYEVELADRETPERVEAVLASGKRVDLKAGMKPETVESGGKKIPRYGFSYKPMRTGDVVISVKGAREVEDGHAWDAYCKQVLHVTRSAGWDRVLGDAVEIVPLTRPYGLRAGSVFAAKLLVNGEPAPGIEIEFEEFNETPPEEIPDEPLVTGLVKTGSGGEFQVTLDREGWWGIAATADVGTTEVDGKRVELTATAFFWVFVHPGR